jgi:hypothetical protein
MSVVDKHVVTANLAAAIDDLMRLEELMPEAERESAHSAIMSMVDRVKPQRRSALESLERAPGAGRQ